MTGPAGDAPKPDGGSSEDPTDKPAATPRPGSGSSGKWGRPPEDLSSERLLRNCPRVNVEGEARPALDRYALLSKLGQGGMGVVYHAVHAKLGTEVAIKLLPIGLHAQEQGLIDRFEREARLAAQLKSDHLVSVLDVAEDDATGCHFIVMEYVRGMGADVWLRKHAAAPYVPEAQALDICIAATRGLVNAHMAGVVHRDIKPANILVPCDAGGRPLLEKAKLADLGLARHEGGEQSITGTAVAMGTPGYMSPEQATDAKRAKKPADVFSMGATLYALLTGNAPFAGSSPADAIVRTAQGRYPPIGQARPDVSHVTAILISTCLSMDPAKRFADAPALLDALLVARSSLAHGEGVKTKATTTIQTLVTLPERGAPVVTPPPTPAVAPAVQGPAAPATAATADKAAPSAPWTPSTSILGIAADPKKPEPAKPQRASHVRSLVVGAIVLAALAVAGFFLLRGGGAPKDASPTKAPVPETPPPEAVAPGLYVTSEPSGGTVTVDGTGRGRTPLLLDDLATGAHVVVVTAPYHREFTSSDARATKGQRTELNAVLARAVGKLSVEGAAPGGKVALVREGEPPKRYDFTLDERGALSGTDVEAGTYSVEITCSNYERSVGRTEVLDLKPTVVRAKMLEDRAAMAPGPVRPDPASPDAPPAILRLPGRASDVEALGWGGKRAKVTFVEGAVADAPIRLQDKPRPQNDWYVNRRNATPKSLNYYATNEGDTSTITSYTLGRLMAVDPDTPPKVQPALATSWEVSEDKLTYIYHLRHGVQFADGRPFSAADVLFSFDVMRDPGVKADHLRGDFESVDSVEAPDPYTIVVKYKTRYWKGIYSFGVTLRVLNKGWYEEQIPVYAKKLDLPKFATEPGKPGFGEVFNKIRIPCPGTGAYYIASDEDYTRDFVNLVQNPFCWSMQCYPEWNNFVKLRWIFINDDQAADEAFRKQEFDVQVVDHDRWADALSKDPTILSISNHCVYDHMGLDASLIYWNCRKAPFDDPRVRRAMTMLTNRQFILTDIERGNGMIAVCKSKRSYPSYSNDLQPIPFDIEGAKKLLAEAGWMDGDGDGVLDKDGLRFEWELKYPSGRRFYTRVCEMLSDACRNAGIRMKQNGLEWATFADDLDNRKFDAVILYNSWLDPWIDLYSEGFHSSQDVPSGGNVSGWRNARVDAITDPMREEFDEDKRNAMFHEFNRIFYDEQPQTLLIHGTVAVLLSKRFEGVKARPTGLQLFDMWVRPENVIHK